MEFSTTFMGERGSKGQHCPYSAGLVPPCRQEAHLGAHSRVKIQAPATSHFLLVNDTWVCFPPPLEAGPMSSIHVLGPLLSVVPPLVADGSFSVW